MLRTTVLALLLVSACDAAAPAESAANPGSPAHADNTWQAPEPIDLGAIAFRWYVEDGEQYPDYGADRPKVLFYVHGWQPKQDPNGRVGLDFRFANVLEQPTVDHAAALQAQGWNVGILDWGDIATTPHPSYSEEQLWTDPQIKEQLRTVYISALDPIVRARQKANLEPPEVWIAGFSTGAQVVALLLDSLVDERRLASEYFPSQAVFLDAYFSRSNELCDQLPGLIDLTDLGRMLRKACDMTLRLDFRPSDKARSAVDLFRRDDRTPSGFAATSYSTYASFTTLLGDSSESFFRRTAHQRLAVKQIPRGFWPHWFYFDTFEKIWTFFLRRHDYPRYWFFSTLVDQVELESGISPSTPARELAEHQRSGTFQSQIVNEQAGNWDLTDDQFETIRWSDVP